MDASLCSTFSAEDSNTAEEEPLVDTLIGINSVREMHGCVDDDDLAAAVIHTPTMAW